MVEDIASISEVWARTFSRVKQEIDVPTVWLAMQAVRPLTIDGNRFIGTIPKDLRYLSMNLDSSEANGAIEQALQEIAGRPLVFHLIDGETIEDWEKEKSDLLVPPADEQFYLDTADLEFSWPMETAPVTSISEGPFAEYRGQETVYRPPLNDPEGPDGFDSWEKLNEFIAQEYKASPSVRYAHGQAKYLLKCARVFSGTIDRLMPRPGEPPDNEKERLLTKSIERLGIVLSLDPLFVSLEIMRYRMIAGKEVF